MTTRLFLNVIDNAQALWPLFLIRVGLVRALIRLRRRFSFLIALGFRLRVIGEEIEDFIEILKGNGNVTAAFNLDVAMLHFQSFHLLDPPTCATHRNK